MINPIGSNGTGLGLRTLDSNREAQARSLQQLSSGKRINSAADDVAASAIVEQFAAQIVGSNQAARNLNDGISQAQVAEGALSSVTDNTLRIRELTVQAGNSTLSAQDRQAIQEEVSALGQANASTLSQASFNGQSLFDGGSKTFQAGPNAGDQLSVSFAGVSASALAGSAGGLDLSNAAAASASLEKIDSDLRSVSGARAELGALTNRFEAGINSLRSNAENLSAARSRMADTDYAATTARNAAERIRSEAGLAVQAQANANSRQVLSLLRT
ncbi:flagellin [Chitinimonas sp. BJYL2]|uniref:flagellin N-terminal helical domain-containing protein n=1 Tax=Chitinimonas sp. BJYL2 TaxID=2976696 RepID=UPI0022B2BE89|nr:flagellin [Chitinimonas sp. BJYL2]